MLWKKFRMTHDAMLPTKPYTTPSANYADESWLMYLNARGVAARSCGVVYNPCVLLYSCL